MGLKKYALLVGFEHVEIRRKINLDKPADYISKARFQL